jgi:hypothetical protein
VPFADNQVLAGPTSGPAAAPSPRVLVVGDIPGPLNQNTTGNAATATTAAGLSQSITSGLPVIGNGTGIIAGTKSGNTTEFVTTTGTLTSGHCVDIDGNGNFVDNGSACGTGGVSTFSFTNGSGFAGTVANASTTPALSLTTSISGVLKGSSGALAAATAGTDYVVPSGNITGTAANLAGIEAIPSPGPSGAYIMGTGAGFVMASPLPNPSPSGAVLQSNGSSWVATNSVLVSQAQFYGSVTTPGTSSSCQWTTTNSTTYVGFAVQSSCPTATAAGNASAPSTKIPAITFASMPPGDYYFVANGEFAIPTASAAANFRFNDGTNSTNGVSVYGGATFIGAPTITGHITYTTAQSNVTIAIQGAASSNYAEIQAGAITAPAGLEILVYYFPTQAQAAQTVATSPAYWGGTSTLSGTTTSTIFADPGSITGAVTTVGTPQNISCVAATGLLGVTCTGSGIQSGGNYEVCASGYYGTSSTALVQVQITDGANTVISAPIIGSIPSTNVMPFSMCGNYTAVSTTETFKIRGATGAGTANFQPTNFLIHSLSTPVNAVTLTGGVSTNYTGGNVRHEFATVSVCTSSPCTLVAGSGAFVITRAGTGSYVATLSSPFSGQMSCTCTAGNSSNTYDACQFLSALPSSSVFNFVTGFPLNTSGGFSNLDSFFTISCDGPR